MAVLFPPGFGDIEYPSGAKLYVYLPNTTTNASLYATSALGGGASLSNPVVANASGQFAQVFVGDGAVYDVRVKTSADVQISGASWDDVPGLGETPGTMSRDFSSGGRFQVSGSAGTVTMAFGDPSPDNTGGVAKIEGWASSALTSLAVRASVMTLTPGALKDEGGSNLTIPGEILQNGSKRSPDIIWTEGTFSAASNVDIALLSGYDVCVLEVSELVFDTSGTAILRFSYDGGSTYKAGSGNYIWTHLATATSASTPTADSGTGTYIKLGGTNTSTNYKGFIRLTITTSSTSNVATLVEGRMAALATAQTLNDFMGVGLNTFGRATHVRLTALSGTLTGRYRLIAKRGLGGTSA